MFLVFSMLGRHLSTLNNLFQVLTPGIQHAKYQGEVVLASHRNAGVSYLLRPRSCTTLSDRPQGSVVVFAKISWYTKRGLSGILLIYFSQA